MNKAIKKKWVKALKSGRYIQGANELHRKDHITGDEDYCCLGVLRHCVTGSNRANATSNDDLLSSQFLRRCGLTASDQFRLVAWNDGSEVYDDLTEKVFNKKEHKTSFKQLAVYIQRYL